MLRLHGEVAGFFAVLVILESQCVVTATDKSPCMFWGEIFWELNTPCFVHALGVVYDVSLSGRVWQGSWLLGLGPGLPVS